MIGSLIYPRLPFPAAQARLIELAALEPSALEQHVVATVAGAPFYPLGIHRASDEKLGALREQVLSVAREHGYPTRLLKGGGRPFDQALTGVLLEAMDILPSDAAERDVWSFLTLSLLPDVALWRFPIANSADGSVNTRYERLIGDPRNVFRRIWWRAFVLGTDLAGLLGEDESVAIMERTGIGGNPAVARAIAGVFVRESALHNIGNRQNYLRDAMKRIRRQAGFRTLHGMPIESRQQLIESAFADSRRSLAPGS